MEIVVVGCRGFGKVHLGAIRDMDISIVEKDRDTINFCTRNYDIRKVYSNFEDALRSDAEIIDLVVPHNLHRVMAINAMRRGKHVLVEKPISTSISEANAMIAESRKNKVKFMVAEQYFFDPTLRTAIKAVKDGRIGDLHSIIVRDQRTFAEDSWRSKSALMGGGALIDGGIHYVETILDIGGEYNSLEGITAKSSNNMEGEDTGFAVFRFNNGAGGLLYYSWNYAGAPRLPSFEIVGSKGAIYEDISDKSLKRRSSRHMNTMFGDLIINDVKVPITRYDVYQREISEFIRSVKENTDVPYNPELALRDLRAVLKIYSDGELKKPPPEVVPAAPKSKQKRKTGATRKSRKPVRKGSSSGNQTSR